MKLAFPKIQVVRIDYSQVNIVPNELRQYLIDLNFVYATTKSDFFHGRKREIGRIFNSLLKIKEPNVILLGEHGVGKSATIQSAVNCVLKRNCPKELRYTHFINLDAHLLLAQMSTTDSNKKNIGGVFEFLTTAEDIAVVIDQVHLMATSNILLYYFKALLQNPRIKVIGITTEDDFYDFFERNTKIMSSVDIIPIFEPKPRKIYSMIKEYVDILSLAHEVTISEDLVNYAISISSAFVSQNSNPGRTTNLIENAMIVAKRRKHKEVTKKDINYNFNFNYELFKNMSLEDKKITAYHEAGHFIVSRMSENIKNFKTTAITIVPADYFLGVTLFEVEMEKQTSMNADYFIDNIAADLAGRVAETILSGDEENTKFTSGAATDLKSATLTARKIITEYGMIESCGKNMTYFCNYDLSDLALLSEDRKKIIDQETEKLIHEAFLRAQKILKSNSGLLDMIAQELLVKEVLDEKDLDRLCKQVNTTK